MGLFSRKGDLPKVDYPNRLFKKPKKSDEDVIQADAEKARKSSKRTGGSAWLVGTDRTEKLEVLFVFNYDQYEANREMIDDILDEGDFAPQIGKFDTYKLYFDFQVHYFGLVKQLIALEHLLQQPELFDAVQLREQDGETMLFVTLIDALRNVEKLLAERTNG